MVSSRTSDDPLLLALRPPKNETAAEREERIKAEEEAVKVSEAIDRELNKERAERKKRRPEIKVLLLGEEATQASSTIS